MTKTVVVVGATGQIGRAAVRRLAQDGWQVTAVSRRAHEDVDWADELGVRVAYLDRADEAALGTALGKGCDVLVDCLTYGAAQAQQLIRLADRIGSAVVISTAVVYHDGQGGSLDIGAPAPHFPVPVTEEQPILNPGEASYGTNKAAMEQVLLAAHDLPVTVLRPGIVHGVGSSCPFEWYFVKRALDQRRVRVLAHRGASQFHTASADNVAEMIRLAAARPGRGALNIGDPQAPTVREIAAAVDEVLGHRSVEVLVDRVIKEGIGQTPWSVPHPIVLDLARAPWSCRAGRGRRGLGGRWRGVQTMAPR